MFETSIRHYLRQHSCNALSLKAVLFDMDGVLYNSMPYHAQAWNEAMKQFGLHLPVEEAYLHEGRTGASTIQIVCQRERGREATETEIRDIYAVKSRLFNHLPKAQPMPGALELLQQLQADGLQAMVVTGSGQTSLLERLNTDFPGVFSPERMVTAFDVQYGKPNPEPYLMALKKGHLRPDEAIVVENAPLGVQAGVAADLFTIALNTGPLADKVLTDEGANLLFPSMTAFRDQWETFWQETRETTL